MWGATEEQKKQIDELKATLHLNLAACQLKINEPYEAAENCSKTLELDASNVKALFRRGQAYNKAGEYEKARKDLIEAAKRDPSNKAIRDEIESVKKNEANAKEKEKAMFGVMVDRQKRQQQQQQQQQQNTQS